MLNPALILDSFVAKLQAIPELVAEMGGDAERISGYHDAFPLKASLAVSIHEMPSPGILVAWTGTAPTGEGRRWKHGYSVFIRSGRAQADDAGKHGTEYFFWLIVNGVPEGCAHSLLYEQVHASCEPMDVPSVVRDKDAEAVDFLHLSTAFDEIGDN